MEDISKSFCDITGLFKEELIGRDFKNLSDLLSIEDQEILEHNLSQFEAGETVEPFVSKIKDKNGEERYLRIETEVIEIGGRKKLFGTACDITERIRTEERADFLHSLLTHDIKNKVQILKGYLELLEDTELNYNQEKLAKKSKKAIKKEVNLVKKVDTLTRISEIKKEEIKIRPIIDSIVSEVQSKADEKGIDIEWDINNVHVMGDSLLDDLLYNVIINSLIHSKGSKIRITSEDMGEYIKIVIEDDGIGISNDLKDIIFQKNSRKEKFAGTGLGMYITKRIAESIDGDIEVKDSELGGARFDICLKKT